MLYRNKFTYTHVFSEQIGTRKQEWKNMKSKHVQV